MFPFQLGDGLMVRKKFILVLLVVLSLFIFACDAQEVVVVDDDVSQPVPEGVDVYGSEVAGDDVDDDVVEGVVSDDDVDDIMEDDLVLDDGFSREFIAQRNTASDCVVGFNGLVYDLTDWLSRHPGGANAIIPYCGTVEEFTEAYNAQHNRAGTKMELSRNEAIGLLV